MTDSAPAPASLDTAFERALAATPRSEFEPRHSATPSQIRESGPRDSARFRPDIEGLRAVAVVLVILDHVGSWPHGGFIGVDVFFVISGFLITGLLINSAIRGRSVVGYFTDFYLRRARRILPASITVLVVCWIAANLAFRGARISQSHTDSFWALGFLANVHFSSIGTDYFQQTRPPSLVQHYWSLAVEEQFYLVWPFAVLIILVLLGRRRRNRGLALLLSSVGMLTLASFAWAVHESSVNPTSAYFSTFVRAWELGVGAVIAVALARSPRMAERVGVARGPLVLLGVVAILASATVIKSTGGFPAPAAVIPVVASAVVIFVGSGTPVRGAGWQWVLTNPVSRFGGRISYSLYLWHWPTIIIAATLLPAHSAGYYVAVVCVTLGLSMLSYDFVERPFRRIPPLERQDARTTGVLAIAAVVLLVVAATAYVFKPEPSRPPVLALVPSPRGSSVPRDPTRVAASSRLTNELVTAIDATSFPQLKPDLDHLGTSGAMKDVWQGCNTLTAVVDSCIYRPSAHSTPSKIMLVIGDSIAMSWLPPLRAELVNKGWTIYSYARGECPAAFVTTSSSIPGGSNGSLGCDQHHQALSTVLSAVKPSFVILTDSELSLKQMKGGGTGAAAGAHYQSGLEETLRLASGTARVVVTLSPPPIGQSLLNCDTAGSTPSSCVGRISPDWETMSTIDRAAATVTHTRYLNTSAWFCIDGQCPAFVGSTPVTYDGVHMTKAYGLSLAPSITSALGI